MPDQAEGNVPTELANRLCKIIESIFVAMAHLDQSDRFAWFYYKSAKRKQFIELARLVSKEDLNSLGLDDPRVLSTREFEVRSLVYEAVQSFGLLPKGKRIARGDIIECPVNEAIAILCDACIFDDAEAARVLIARVGSDVFDHNLQTPLMYAVGNNSVRCVQLLIESGCNVTLANPNDLTAFDYLNPVSVHFSSLKKSLVGAMKAMK